MDKILRYLIEKIVVVFILMMFWCTTSLDHLSVVFEVLRAARLFGNLEMCTFCIEHVSFLDYRDSVGD